MARFTITISRDGDKQQGLASLRDIISNGLSCITRDVIVAEYNNAIDLVFNADPTKIELEDPDAKDQP